jgi:hypothetical protein
MKRVNVDGMLREISAKQFIEWIAFDELEPIGGLKDDYRAASIVATLVNLRRNVEKFPAPIPISNFLLKWGDELRNQPAVKPPQKTWQQLKLIGQVMAASYNMMEEAKHRRRKKE